MTTHGLLMEDHQGQEYLLATEPCLRTKTRRLVVLQRIDDRWEPVIGRQIETCRESVICAVIDFLSDVRNAVNSKGSESEIDSGSAPRVRRSRARASSKPNQWSVR